MTTERIFSRQSSEAEKRIACTIMYAIRDERDIVAVFNALVDVFTFYMSMFRPQDRDSIAQQLQEIVPEMLAMARSTDQAEILATLRWQGEIRL